MIASLSDGDGDGDDGACVVRQGIHDDSQVAPSVIYTAEVVASG